MFHLKGHNIFPTILLNQMFASFKVVNVYQIVNFRYLLMLTAYRVHVPDVALSNVLKTDPFFKKKNIFKNTFNKALL